MTKEPGRRSESKFWRIAKRLGVLVTLAAFPLAIFTIIYTIWSKPIGESLGAEMRFNFANRLTSFANVPGLEGSFTYEKHPVRDLWILNLELVNTGSQTIIGRDSKKNIIGDNIRLEFPPEVRVLEVNQKRSTFPHELATSQAEDNVLELSFAQWRKGESAFYSLFVSADKVQTTIPLPTVDERCIIDGDLLVLDQHTVFPRKVRRTLISLLPSPMPHLAGLSVVTCTFLIIVMISAIIKDLWTASNCRSWENKYSATYREHVDSLLSAGGEKYGDMLLTNPWLLPEEGWKGFAGPRYPAFSPSFLKYFFPFYVSFPRLTLVTVAMYAYLIVFGVGGLIIAVLSIIHVSVPVRVFIGAP